MDPSALPTDDAIARIRSIEGRLRAMRNRRRANRSRHPVNQANDAGYVLGLNRALAELAAWRAELEAIPLAWDSPELRSAFERGKGRRR